MRRSVIATLLIVATAIPLAISGTLLHGYAQTSGPQGDEFNSPTFTAPFVIRCAQFAPNCPDPPGPNTYSLDASNLGMLRIWSQYGSLLGTAQQSSNNARDLVLQPFASYIDFTVTTKLTFPGMVVQGSSAVGQTAGLIVYQDQDNFLFVGRVFSPGATSPSQIEFVQEIAGVDTIHSVPENYGALAIPTVNLRLTKVGNTYSAFYSYDNTNFVQVAGGVAPTTLTPTATTTPQPTATATTLPSFYIGNYQTPQIGLFSLGGTNAAVTNLQLPADFDWFRVGPNSLTPGPTAAATSTATGTALPTSTAIPSSTPIPSVTSTPAPTATTVPTATTAPTSTPTNAPIPTPTPLPRRVAKPLAFRYVSIWYHSVRKNTFEHLEVQSNKHTTLGIWIHVFFPSGVNFNYYENTDVHGHWSKSFNVPANSGSRYNDQAIVALQLWRGSRTAKDFEFFTVL